MYKKKLSGFALVTAVYNEERNIRSIIDNYKRKGFEEIVVVNDGSADTTSKILSDINDIKVVNNAKSEGYGKALYQGLNEITCPHALLVTCNFDLKIDLNALYRETVNNQNDITLICGSYRNSRRLVRFMERKFKIIFPNFSADCILINRRLLEQLKSKTISRENILSEFVRIACISDDKIGFYHYQNHLPELRRGGRYIAKRYTKDAFDFTYTPTYKSEIIIGAIAGIAGGLVILLVQEIIKWIQKSAPNL